MHMSKAIVAENYLCFYALLQMVLEDMGFEGYNQITLANVLGVTVPKAHTIDGIEQLNESTDIKQIGAHVTAKELNAFFENFGIPIEAKFISANPFEEYGDIDEQYVIYALSYGSLFKKDNLMDVGHAVLKIHNEFEQRVRIYDPGPYNSGEKVVSIFDLYDAIYKRKGGVYIFRKTE